LRWPEVIDRHDGIALQQYVLGGSAGEQLNTLIIDAAENIGHSGDLRRAAA
jgi:hypothetical protein